MHPYRPTGILTHLQQARLGRGFVAVLLVWALYVTHILVPVGFMPTRTDAGATIRICTGAGVHNITIDELDSQQDHQPEKPAKSVKPQMLCSFAVAAAQQTITPDTFALPAPIIGQIIQLKFVSDRLFSDPDRITGQPRAPPHPLA